MPLSPLQETPRDVPCKTRGQDGFATSFPVGLLHPLQHAGLSRRTPACPSSTPSAGKSEPSEILYLPHVVVDTFFGYGQRSPVRRLDRAQYFATVGMNQH